MPNEGISGSCRSYSSVDPCRRAVSGDLISVP